MESVLNRERGRRMSAEPSMKLVIGKELDDRYTSMMAERFPFLKMVKVRDGAEQEKELEDADILFSRMLPEDPSMAPSLKWVQFMWEGVDTMSQEFRESDIILTNAGGIHSTHMAEHVMMYLLALSRDLRMYLHHQDDRFWLDWWHQPRLGKLKGSTLGIIGYGRIGNELARLATGFDMRILALKKDPSSKKENAFGPPWTEPDMIFGPGQLEDMLVHCDHVVVTLPLTEDTRGMFEMSEFEKMKDTAIFVNVGRGEVVKEEDLIAALKDGKIAGAGLDVFEEEPLSADSPLWEMENVIVTPHSSVGGDPEDEEVVSLFMENMDRFLKGDKMLNLIDKSRGY